MKDNPGWRGKIEFDSYDVDKILNGADIEGMANDLMSSFINLKNEEETGRSGANKILAKIMNDNDVTVSNFAKKCVEKAKVSAVIKASNLDDYVDVIAEGRLSIKGIKLVQKHAEGEINEFLRTAKKDIKEHSDINKLNKQASTLETVVSAYCKGCIAVVKANIAATRKALGAALSSLRKYKGEEAEAEEAAAVAEMAIAFA